MTFAFNPNSSQAFRSGSGNKLAGDVVPFPVSPQVADTRRLNYESLIDSVSKKMGLPQSDVRGHLNASYGSSVIKGPGANE